MTVVELSPSLTVRDMQRGVLACMLRDPRLSGAGSRVRARLTVAEFTGPEAKAFTTLTLMADFGEPVEPTAFRQRLVDSGANPMAADDYTLDLVKGPWMLDSLDFYVNRVVEGAQKRRLRDLFSVGAAAVEAGEVDLHEIVSSAMGGLESLSSLGLDDDDMVILDDLMALPVPETQWLLPGLMPKRSRLLITAPEGVGKSYLVRMLGVCLAAGLHPFDLCPIEPHRVLMIDCENSEEQSQEYLHAPFDVAAHMNFHVQRRFALITKDEGIDLSHGRDLNWVLQRVDRFRPDLVVIGPLYKLHTSDPNKEETARQLAAALDRIRKVGDGVAILTEAHAAKRGAFGHRTLEPVGSSLWMRWPESIKGLQPIEIDGKVCDEKVRIVKAGRNDRKKLQWPTGLRWGGRGEMPWVTWDPDEPECVTRGTLTGVA